MYYIIYFSVTLHLHMNLKYSRNLFLILSLLVAFILSPDQTLATDTAALSPATMADDTSIGAAVWSNANNAKVSDDAYATATSVCFVAGTKVKTSGGDVSIEELQAGQSVLGFDSNQQIKNSRIAAVGSKVVDEVIRVVTEGGVVTVTAEHPFYVGNGAFKQIQNIAVGEYIYNSDFLPQQILSKTVIHERTRVYNIEVDDTHTYFAENFAVHNKTIWHYLKASDFGFEIPTRSIINGIRAEIEFKSNSTYGTDNVRIVKGGVIGSTNMGIFSNNFPLTDTSTFYGSSSDLWGETWTAADINSSDFGFVFSVDIFGETVSVDHMTITVSYTTHGRAHHVSSTVYTVGSYIPATTTPTSTTSSVAASTSTPNAEASVTAPMITFVNAPVFTKNLFLSITDPEVKLLQEYLNTHGFPVASSGPGSLGSETTRFGSLTQSALAKFQKANGITPSSGYFGPKTRALIK